MPIPHIFSHMLTWLKWIASYKRNFEKVLQLSKIPTLSLCNQNDSFNKRIHQQPDIEKKVFIGELVINFIPKLCWLAVIVKMVFIKFISLILEF